MESNLTYIFVVLFFPAAKEVQKLPSLSASYKKDVDQSVICHNFTFGNGRDEFYSPNYPNNYPNNTECEKVIRG